MVVSSDSASLVVALRLLSNIMRVRIMYIADILDVNNALCSNVPFTTSLRGYRGYPRKKDVCLLIMIMSRKHQGEEKEIRCRILIEPPKRNTKELPRQ